MIGKILNYKKQILASVLAICVYFVLQYSNIFSLVINKFKGSSDIKQCVEKMTPELSGIRFVLSISGVPENQLNIALKEMIRESCNCIVNAAAGSNFEYYATDPENSKAVKKCSSEATELALKKYAK